jgi:hypothetical protein
MKNMKKTAFRIPLLAIVVSLTGCASSGMKQIDKPIQIGDKTYTGIYAERVNPWGGNATTVAIMESSNGEQRRVDYSSRQTDSKDVLSATPRRRYTERYAEYESSERLSNTHIVSDNKQGSIGWANNALHGVAGGAILGATSMGAARLIRPAIMKGGNSSSSSSSSASAAAAAAAGP